MASLISNPVLGNTVADQNGEMTELPVSLRESAWNSTAMLISCMGLKNTLSAPRQYRALLFHHSTGQCVSRLCGCVLLGDIWCAFAIAKLFYFTPMHSANLSRETVEQYSASINLFETF